MVSYAQENKLVEKLNFGEGETFFQLFDALNIPVYCKDNEGHYFRGNQHLLELIGVQNQEELVGKTDEELWGHPEDTLWMESDRLALENGHSQINIVKVISGKRRFFSVAKTRLVSEYGKVVGVLAAFKEFIEQDSQKLVLNTGSLIEQVIDNVEASIYWKDLNGKILGCNRYMLDMFGATEREQIIGKNEYDLVPKKEAVRFTKIDQSVIANGRYVGEEVCTISSGEKITFLTVKNRLCDKDGKPIGLVGTSLNISSYKRATEAKLNNVLQSTAEKSHQMMQIIDLVSASIYWKDKEGHYLGCNKFVLDMAGVNSREDIIGKTDAELIWKAHAPVLMKVDQHVIEHGGYAGEEVVNKADGTVMTALTVKNQLRDSEGNVIGIIGTSLDITAQKEAERNQLEAQKKAELLNLEMEREHQKNEILQLEKKAQQFLSEQQSKFKEIVKKMDHDIRTPLQTISSTLNSCDELPEEKLDRLRLSLNNAFKVLFSLGHHYGEAVDSGPSKSESRQGLLMADFVSEVLDEKKYQYIHHPIDFELHITEAAKTAHIEAQPVQLHRTLSNIINNAVDALPEHKPGLIRVEVNANEKRVEIIVDDNGRGMTPEAVQRILKHIAFTENKTDGHGLGLQQVWDTLEYNRGKMQIESAIGVGTTIKLGFPRFKPADWLVQEIVLYPNTILLVLDDETLFHQSWDMWIGPTVRRNRGLQIKYFSEGEALLNFVSALTNEERTRVLLFADYELTFQQQNGLQVIVNSKINNAILITGHTSNAEVRKAALEHGINLLPKQLIADIPVRLEK